MNFNATAPITSASVKSEVTSVPQLLFQEESGTLTAHISGPMPTRAGRVVQGMAVTNRERPGVIAYAHVPPATANGSVSGGPEQSLVCTIHGNDVGPLTRTFRFSSGEHALGAEREGHLLMTVDSAEGKSQLIPLIPAPGSIAVGRDLSPTEMSQLSLRAVPEIDLGRIMSGVLKSVPILADAGLQIYEQVSGGGQVQETRGGRYRDPENVQFFPALGAIANVALPFVGSLIKSIAG